MIVRTGSQSRHRCQIDLLAHPEMRSHLLEDLILLDVRVQLRITLQGDYLRLCGSLRLLLLRKLIPSVVGWRETKKKKRLEGWNPLVEKKEASEEGEEKEDPEEEEDPDEEVPASTSLRYLWISVPQRTTYSSSRSWSVVPSILSSIVVMPWYRDCQMACRIDCLIVRTLRVMIFLEFGHRHHRARVFRVPHLVDT
ncbi:hypothetical protein PIB30_067785 [Stylosanthes scabra]|uniref:Uncharacterized protein n=1 Tax=Stylosanthes scabra TaxID=79078 RepID=A0ABU6TQ39_9FABA|nr:hypothetical protein [Stylosanthes scabra]